MFALVRFYKGKWLAVILSGDTLTKDQVTQNPYDHDFSLASCLAAEVSSDTALEVLRPCLVFQLQHVIRLHPVIPKRILVAVLSAPEG